MKLSKSFFVTYKDIKEEDAISSTLLTKAGFVKRTSAGVYMLLPLGLKVFRNIENIIRKHMNNIDSQELTMPILINEEVYVESNRRELFGNDMFSLKDKFDKPYVLGPTHEELFVNAAALKVKSYKDLPVSLYQIQTKFRDETRPRYGLVRVREFLMKDAYTFDTDLESLDKSYNEMFDAYHKIFKEIGLDYVVVKADTGAMGGLLSEEFQALSDIGEDNLIICTSCDYASNEEIHNGDVCPKCNSSLITKKGIEIGNTFKLGTKYSDMLNLKYSNKENKLSSIFMGCYGIGIGRLLASYIEQNNDNDGIIFNQTIAPYKVAIINASIKDNDINNYCNSLYNTLNDITDTILDDRNISTGIKFKDMNLIGVPIQIIIGKNYKDNNVEVKFRKTGNSEIISLDKIEEYIKELIK